jgi:hypothetical protein
LKVENFGVPSARVFDFQAIITEIQHCIEALLMECKRYEPKASISEKFLGDFLQKVAKEKGAKQKKKKHVIKNMKQTVVQYLLRAVKHLVRMALLIVAIYFVMDATDTLGIQQNELLGTRGIILAVALVAISAAYPSYGFVCRTANASFRGDRSAIIRAFGHIGYGLHSESDGQMVFRASSPLKRLWQLGDDKVVVTPLDSNTVEVCGVRKEVVEVIYHIAGTTQQPQE